MSRKLKSIAILIPCHNEEEGITKVIKGIPIAKLKKLGYRCKIFVVDNNSTDKTSERAKKLGAKVIFEKELGKGNALKAGFKNIPKNFTYIAIIDGDNTYKGNEIPRLIEPIDNKFADIIVGSRLSGKTKHNSLNLQHRLANWFYTFLIRHFYRVNTTDVLSGFIAFRSIVVRKIVPKLESRGFAIEMEINIKASRMGFSIFSVPITYDVREGNSKLEGFRDVFVILKAFFMYLVWKPSRTLRRQSH